MTAGFLNVAVYGAPLRSVYVTLPNVSVLVTCVAYCVWKPNLKSCEPLMKSLALCASDASIVVRLCTWRLPVAPLPLVRPVPESMCCGVTKSSLNGVKLSRM